jgi:hypothetical protein
MVEKIIFAACKRFAEDLIRQACQDNFNTGTSSSSSSSSQKFPSSLHVKDVYETMVKHNRFDFLTNKYMSTNSEDGHEEEENESQLITQVEAKK